MSEYWADPDETAGTCQLPGIYRITVEGAGIYIGRYTNASRPMREYRRNVAKLIGNHPYRPRKPEGFRRVHRALHDAVTSGRPIRIEIVENAEISRLNERERHWIARVPPHLRLNGRNPLA